MSKKLMLTIALFLCIAYSFSQSKSLNEYKYVIIPTSYDFLKEPDQYQINSLTKFLFEKNGFVALMDDEPIPQELINNICLALYADVLKNPGMMKTKLQVQLKNCKREVVFISDEGLSREKKYKVAYNLALRQAFESVKVLDHKFDPEQSIKTVSDTTPVLAPTANTIINNSDINQQEAAVNEEENLEQENELIDGSMDSETLYAQPINNGYQLVNSKPEVVYVLIFSGKKDFFMVKGKDATVYKLNDNWVIAETIGDDLQVRTLNIKF